MNERSGQRGASGGPPASDRGARASRTPNGPTADQGIDRTDEERTEDGESTTADPSDDPLDDGDATARSPGDGPLPIARPRKGASGGFSSVQIDAVVGDRVPAIVVRRSIPEIMDPASRIERAVPVPAAVELDRLMGRALGSPVEPAQRTSAAPEGGAGRVVPDPASRRSLPALDSGPRPSPPLDCAPSPSRLPAADLSVRRSLPLPDDGRRGARSPAPRDTAARSAADGGRDELAAAREVTHIHAAAALGIAPEPALPPTARTPAALGGPAERPPPPFELRLDRGVVQPFSDDRRPAPPPRAPTALHADQPRLAVPAAALLGHRRRSSTTTWAILVAGSVLLAAAGFAARQRATASAHLPAAHAVRSMTQAPVAVPPGETGIRLLTRPPRARVLVDGHDLGRAPLLLRRRDDRSRYALEIRARGFRPWRGVLRLEGERPLLVPEEGSAGLGEVGSDEHGPSLVIALDRE